jgi:hypothetical protein
MMQRPKSCAMPALQHKHKHKPEYSGVFELQFQGYRMAVCASISTLVITEYPNTFHMFSFADTMFLGSMAKWLWEVTRTWNPDMSWQDHVNMPTVTHVTFATDGTLFAITTANNFVTKCVSIIDIHTQTRTGVLLERCSGRDSPQALAGGKDTVAVSCGLWDMEERIEVFKRTGINSWTLVHTLSGFNSPLAWAPCGTRLAAFSVLHKKTRLHIWSWDPDIAHMHECRTPVDCGEAEFQSLMPYGKHWLVSDDTGRLWVVWDKKGSSMAMTRVTNSISSTGLHDVVHVPTVGILFLHKNDKFLILEQSLTHKAMLAMSPLRCAWMAAVTRGAQQSTQC